MTTKHKKSRPGFWTGVLVGLFAGLIFSRLRPDPNRVARAGYNLVSPIYDHWYGERPLADLRQQLVEMLDLKPGDKVLEVSVGTGANLPFMAARLGPSGHIDGLDISEGMLAQARKKVAALPCRVELRQGMAEDLPFPDNYFDAVLHLGGINFFSDRRRALEEMLRVAKPGAKIVVSDETIAPFDGLRGMLSRAVLFVIPRLRPPIELAPALHPVLHYLRGGYIYAIEGRKAEQP